jgi:hypothetical protein
MLCDVPSELVVGIPHFQPPLFTHLDFAFSPLSVTYDEEALKSLINFFVPPRRERAVFTALVLLSSPQSNITWQRH